MFLLGVELVDGVIVLGPLEIRLDLADQGCAVTLRNIQFLILSDAILLESNTVIVKLTHLHQTAFTHLPKLISTLKKKKCLQINLLQGWFPL